MKRLGLAALVLAIASSAAAQTTSNQGPGYYMGPTGFDLNLGVTTKSFRCGCAKLQRGVGTLTLNGTTTVTVVPTSGFNVIVPPDALPGADGVFFRTSGLWYRLASTGIEYYNRISAKASDASITVLAGAAANPNVGTATEWGYWNVWCYRSASAIVVNNVTTDHQDNRIWSTITYLSKARILTPMEHSLRQAIFTPAASSTLPNMSLVGRPRGFNGLLAGNNSMAGYASPSGTANEIVLQTPQGTNFGQSFKNGDVQFQLQSSVAASYLMPMLWSAQ